MKRDENHRVWAVGSLILAIGDAISGRFNPVQVEGEVSSWTTASSGHCYFVLKDESGQLRCAMFRRQAAYLDKTPKEGDWVRVTGKLDIYPARGELQLVVESLSSTGQGQWYERFLELQKRLQTEGLFDSAKKKPIPQHPQHIAIVSSLEAAALKDVCVTLQRRAPFVHVSIFHSPVQGVSAASSLVAALQSAQAFRDPTAGSVETILLVRGGGSIEDLWSFNDERLAYAIANSLVPVICGVGHETDFTIADFVADLRAPTPTAAAELCCTSLADERKHLDQVGRVIMTALEQKSQRMRGELETLRFRLAQPNRHLIRHQQRLDEYQSNMIRSVKSFRHQQQMLLHGYATTLQSLHPQRVLERGYAMVSDEEGHLITHAAHLKAEQQVHVQFGDGSHRMTVNPNGSSNLPRMDD